MSGVPWLIDENALHSADVCRVLAFAAFAGREGIIRTTDWQVKELATPGTQVRVLPGAGAIRNRALGKLNQNYVHSTEVEEQVDIAPTAIGQTRSDLIVMRVENPYLSGEPWQNPIDPAVGPYTFPRVIANVDPTTTTVQEVDTNMSAIPLARVDIPENTATITQSMITSLRFMSNALTDEWEDSRVCGNGQELGADQTTYIDFPNQAQFTQRVPEWATHMSLYAWVDPQVTIDGVHANWRWVVDGVATPAVDIDCNFVTAGSQGDQRTMKAYATRVAIDPASRGQDILIKSEMAMNKDYVDHAGVLRAGGPGAGGNGTIMIIHGVWRQSATEV